MKSILSKLGKEQYIKNVQGESEYVVLPCNVYNEIIEMLDDYGLAQAMKSSETENIYYSKDEDLELLKND